MDAPTPRKPVELTLQQALAVALQLKRAQREDEARAIYQFIFQRWPDQPAALFEVGCIAQQQGRHQEAADLLGRAVAIDASQADYHLELGRVLFSLDKAAQAAECFARAVELDANDGQAHHFLGIALQDVGRLDEAAAALRAAVSLCPDDANVWTDLGVAIQSSGGDVEEAADAFRRALAINPRLAAAMSNLAESQRVLGRFDEAVATARAALMIDPTFAGAYNNLAAALLSQNRIEEAIPPLERAIQLAPGHAQAHASLAGALHAIGRVEEAADYFRRATVLKPDLALAWSGLLYTTLFRVAPAPSYQFEQHAAWGKRVEDSLGAIGRPHGNDRSPDRKLRIGYVSPDFRGHSVAFFFEPILEHHDRAAFEAVCYFNWRQGDEVTERLKSHAAQWRDVAGLSDERLAEQIREDEIDILVDLAGHSAHNRLPVFARKPAPVQVTYLGYPATTGLSQIDYRLTDAIADMPGKAEALHSERLVRLRCAWCYRPAENCPEVSPLPAEKAGASGGITFGCCNHLAKLSPETIALFGQVLQAAPGSRLVLKSRGLESPQAQRKLIEAFLRHGVAASRIEMLAATPKHRDHLEVYHRIDIALDTFPYVGTTTTCEALWMGVPVMTLAGRAHVSRVGASLLTAAGLSELVARDSAEYAAIAASLAGDVPRLTELRRTLRERVRNSPLTDGAAFTRNLEVAYRDMWRRWVNSQGNRM